MNPKIDIPPTKPIHLIHNMSCDYSRVTMRVTISGVEITSVALDANRQPKSQTFHHKIEPKSPHLGLDFILPPDTSVIIRDLHELP